MEGDPSESRPGSSRLEDDSNSRSALSSPQERRDFTGALQERILNFTEDEWMVFSSMLHTSMTRMQFAELCMAVLKVVSLSSIAVILPAYVCVAKASRPTSPMTSSVFTSTERSYRSSRTTSPESLKTDGDVMDESERAPSSPLEFPSGPVSDLLRRMKGTLASLRRTVAWCPPAEDSACSASERSASTRATTETHGDASHDLTCITTILDRLVASGRIHMIAKNLVSQVQGAMRESGPASFPVASKSVSDSVLTAKVMAAPKRTLSASHIVHTYAEEAIKNLLQPYFIPFTASDMTSTKASSSSSASSRPHSATTRGLSPSLLGLEKDECSCLMTKLMQRLPAGIRLRESVGSPRPRSAPQGRGPLSPSQGFSEVADLFTRVMTFQVMEIVDSELKRHEQARLLSADQEETIVGDVVQGRFGGLFSGLIQRFISEFLHTESADDICCTPSSRSPTTPSGIASRDSESAAQNLKNVLGLFTRVMVSQVMDIIQAQSTEEQVSSIAEEQPCSSISRPSSAKFSVLGSDGSDNGCLVTALMLRLLVKLRDQSTSSPDTVEASRELIGKILSEFSSSTGTPNFHAYQNNVKLQTVYKEMDKFLLKEFGPRTVLQKALETQDESFDTILLLALTKELLPRGDVEVSAAPSPQSSLRSTSLSVASGSRSLKFMQGVADGHTSREKARRWLKIKMPKLGRKKVNLTNTLSDFAGEHVEPAARLASSAMTSDKMTLKCSFFKRMFTSCFRGSSEHE